MGSVQARSYMMRHDGSSQQSVEREPVCCGVVQAEHRHDLDGAMKLVLENADDNFREHVKLWAAVHALPQR